MSRPNTSGVAVAPRVSIVMAAYNAADALDQAIQSIIQQTYSDWELLVVDDASRDQTPAVLEKWLERDPRIRLLKTETNCGLAACLNLAIHRARGTLIARMDADDWSAPERLDAQIRFLEAHPDIDILGTGAELVDETGQRIATYQLPCSHDIISRTRFRRAPVMHPTVVARRHVFDALGGYDEQLRRSQDTDLWLRAISAGFLFANLPDPLLRYRAHPPSFRAVLYGSWVLARAAAREQRFVRAGWSAAVFFAAGIARLILRDARGSLWLSRSTGTKKSST